MVRSELPVEDIAGGSPPTTVGQHRPQSGSHRSESGTESDFGSRSASQSQSVSRSASAPPGSPSGPEWGPVTEVRTSTTTSSPETAEPPAPENPAPEILAPESSALDVPAPESPPSAVRRRRAVLGGLWSAASQVVPAFGTAVLSVVAGRLLGSSALGQQSLIAYVNAAAASIVIYSLNTALLQLGGRLQGRGDAASLRRLTRWAIGAHLASGIVVLAAMAVSAELVGQNRTAWLVIGAVSVADAVADGLAVRLILVEGWGPVGRLRLVFQLLGPPLGIAFLAAGYGITGIFVGDGLAALALMVAVAVRFRRQRGRPLIPDVDSEPAASHHAATDLAALDPALRDDPAGVATAQRAADTTSVEVWALRRGVWAPAPRTGRKRAWWRPPVAVWRIYGLFSIDAVISQVVTKRVEFIVLAIFASDSAIGMYSVAFMAVNLVSMIPLGIAGAAMPLVAAAEGRGELASANRHLRLALRLGSIIAVLLVGFLATVGPFAVTFVYGAAYAEAARLVPLASLGLLVAVVSGVCVQFWAGQGRLAIVLGSGVVAGAADLGAAFALVPVLGATGAVVANLAGQIALAGALLVATVRNSGPIGWRLRGLLGALVVAVLAAVAGRAAAWAVGLAVPSVEAHAAAQLIAAALAFVAVGAVGFSLVRPFHDDEAHWLRPLVPGRARSWVNRLTVTA